MSGRLEGKVAIVTGAGCVGPGWGNGRAAAVRFAEEGAKVFAVDLNPEALEETIERAGEQGASMTTHVCDVTDSASIAGMVEACVEAYGRVDVLVNNVGGSAKGGPVELAEEVWDAQVDYNLKSVFLTCKHVIPAMERQGDDARFLAEFEGQTLTRAEWTHEAHVRMAWLMSRRESTREDALQKMCAGIRALNRALGTPSQLYHETVTRAFGSIVHARATRPGAEADWPSERSRDANCRPQHVDRLQIAIDRQHHRTIGPFVR